MSNMPAKDRQRPKAIITEEHCKLARKQFPCRLTWKKENLCSWDVDRPCCENCLTARKVAQLLADALKQNRQETLKEARNALKLRDSRALFECWLKGEINE